MKRVIIILVLICSMVTVGTLNTFAENKESWYLKRKGQGEPPDFPNSYGAVKENGGFAYDENAWRNQEKVIYLTFDAGYENGNIEKILDILRDNEVSASFFILSNLINKNTDLVKRMASEGHQLCNHTKNHKDMTTLTNEEMQANLNALEVLCVQKTGCEITPYFRFPEGTYSKEKLELCNSLGYKTVFWSVTHADWDNNRQPGPEKSYKLLTSYVHPGAIILLHPTSETNVQILPRLIKTWKDMGYSFATVDKIERC